MFRSRYKQERAPSVNRKNTILAVANSVTSKILETLILEAITHKFNRRPYISTTAATAWLQAMLNRYNSVQAANTSIDTKLGVITAAAFAILVFSAPETQETSNLLLWIGFLGAIVAIIFALIGMHLRSINAEVQLHIEHPEYYNQRDEAFIWQLISDLEPSIAVAEAKNKSKSRFYNSALYVFAASVATIIASQFIMITISKV